MVGDRVADIAGFGASHFGRTLVWVAADVYALFALTDVAGLAAPVAGAVFLGVMLLSAAADLAVGRVVDRFGVPPSSVLMIAAAIASACFAASLMVTDAWISVLAAVGFRLAYAVYDVPHNAMLKRLSDGGASVVSLSLTRYLTGAAAGFAVAALAGHAAPHGIKDLSALALVTGIGAAASMVLYAPVVAKRADRRDPSPASRPTGAAEAAGPTVLLLLGIALMGCVMGALLTKALAFVADRDLHQTGWLAEALTVLTAARLGAAPVWAFMARRVGSAGAAAAAFGVIAAGAAVLALLGSGQGLALAIGLLGAGFSGVTVCSWALLPDLSASLTRRSDRDPIHTTVGAYTAINKVAVGVSGACMAGLLAWSQASASARPIAGLVGFFLLAGSVACVVAFLGYLRKGRGMRPAATVLPN